MNRQITTSDTERVTRLDPVTFEVLKNSGLNGFTSSDAFENLPSILATNPAAAGTTSRHSQAGFVWFAKMIEYQASIGLLVAV